MANVKDCIQLVLFEHPFFATIILHQEIVDATNNPRFNTMAVDGKKLYYDQNFADEITTKECIGVLCHEALHVALGHPALLKDLVTTSGYPEALVIDVFNTAADYVINAHLHKDNIELPKPHLYREDTDDTKKTVEQVFWELIRNPPPPNTGSASMGVLMPCEGDPAESAVDAKTLTLQAAAAAKGIGRIPGAVKGYIDELTAPRADWRVILRRFLTNSRSSGYTFTRPNRRYIQSAIRMPSFGSRGMPALNCIFDSSGSVSTAEFTQFLSELNAAVEQMGIKDVVSIVCDTKIQAIHQSTVGQGQIKFNPDGRGGTDMTPAFEHLQTIRPAPTICFSDMEFFSEPGPRPSGAMLWCRIGRAEPPKWGQLVDITL